MFDIRKKNKYNMWLSYLIANFLTQDIFDKLKKERSESLDFSKYKTSESLKEEKFRWLKKYLVITTQDLLDILAERKTNKLQGKKEIRKDPYFFEMLKLLGIECTHNQKKNDRKKLEKMITKRIKELTKG